MKRNTLLAVCLILAGMTGQAGAATNFIYDIYQQAPSTFPSSPPWTDNGALFGFINGSDSATASGRLLTIVDGPEFNDPSHYWQHNLSAAEISFASEYEIRARVRIMSYGDLGGGERPLFTAVVEDGSRFLGLGASKVGNDAHFFLMDGGFTPFISYTAPLTGDDFFNVVLRKTGTTGTSSDLIYLYVDGVLVAPVYGTHTQNYGNLPGPDPTRAVYFGAGASPAFGTIQMTGVSFGIDQFAPALLPEPSSLMLGLAGLLFCVRSFKARR